MRPRISVGLPDTLMHLGISDFRVGCRLFTFVIIVMILMLVKGAFIRSLPSINDQAVHYLVNKVLKFAVFLFASWIMARVEGRTIAEYGLPWRGIFSHRFWKGAALAIVGLTAFLTLSRVVGLFRFGSIALQGVEIPKWGALYALGFSIVALEEEFHYRGYGLYTLTQGIGFWPAAVVSSAIFGYSHLGNPGENWLGVFNVGAAGLLFCLLLRRSGDLWMPIGFHASWDWSQSYFYGVPDSGHSLPGHLFGGTFSGPRWLTGGTVGPEGSVFLTFLVILFWVCVWVFMGEMYSPNSSREAEM